MTENEESSYDYKREKDREWNMVTRCDYIDAYTNESIPNDGQDINEFVISFECSLEFDLWVWTRDIAGLFEQLVIIGKIALSIERPVKYHKIQK